MTHTCRRCADLNAALPLGAHWVFCPITHRPALLSGPCAYSDADRAWHHRQAVARAERLGRIVSPICKPYASQRGAFRAEIAQARCRGVCVDDKGVCDALRPDGECVAAGLCANLQDDGGCCAASDCHAGSQYERRQG